MSATSHDASTIPTKLTVAIGGILFGVVVIGVFAVAFGGVGAAILMAPAWLALLRTISPQKSPEWWGYSLAGAAAGLLHVAIAAMVAQGSVSNGVNALFGTWLLGKCIADGLFLPMLAPPLAGALSGLLCWRIVKGRRS